MKGMCVRMLYLLAEELYRDFPWCQRSMKSLRSEAKKKHVQLVEIAAMSEIPATDAEAVVMLLCSTQSWVERRIAEANARGVHPVALYNRTRRPEHACSVVTMDIDEAMRLAIDYLRDFFDCNDKYKSAGDFVRNVIEVNLGFINQYTNLKVSFRKHKKGRSISHVIFKYENTWNNDPKAEEHNNQMLDTIRSIKNGEPAQFETDKEVITF